MGRNEALKNFAEKVRLENKQRLIGSKPRQSKQSESKKNFKVYSDVNGKMPRKFVTLHKLRLVKSLVGEYLYDKNLNFSSAWKVLKSTNYSLFVRIGRDEFDLMALQNLRNFVQMLKRFEKLQQTIHYHKEKEMQVILVLSNPNKRYHICSLLEQLDFQDCKIMLDEQRSTVEKDSFHYNEEKEIESYEQLQKYCSLNLNKFFDGLEYWHNVEKFGQKKSRLIGPTFILTDLNDGFGSSMIMDWSCVSETSTLGSLAVNKEFFAGLKQMFQSQELTAKNTFLKYQKPVCDQSDFFMYRQKMREKKSKYLAHLAKVNKNRFSVLFFDLGNEMRHKQEPDQLPNGITQNKVIRSITYLCGEYSESFSPENPDGIALIYRANIDDRFDLQHQDFLQNLLSFYASTSEFHSFYKLWFVPLVDCRKNDDTHCIQERQNKLKKFKKMITDAGYNYPFQNVVRNYEDCTCLKTLLKSRPIPPVLIGVRLDSMRHLLCVDSTYNVDKLSKPSECRILLKRWLKDLNVNTSSGSRR